ncbi:peptide transporter family 1-like [Rhodnius prolixus]|uniref:peptide transporter family 1-like n=1 Tax=Rhodnius prolixus TaxID=13249 RepID=UPI003D18D9B4
MINTIKAATKGFPKMVWWALMLEAFMKVFGPELILPQQLLRMIEIIEKEEESQLNLTIFLDALRGFLNLLGAFIAITCIDKYTISVTSFSLFTSICIPSHLFLALRTTTFSKIELNNWRNFSNTMLNTTLFGEATYFVVLCEQFHLPKQIKQFYLFLTIHFWLQNFAIVIASILQRFLSVIEITSLTKRTNPLLLVVGVVAGYIFVMYLLINMTKFHRPQYVRGVVSRTFKYAWHLIETKFTVTEERKATEKPDGEKAMKDTKDELCMLCMLLAMVPLIIFRQERGTSNWLYQFYRLNVSISNFTVYPFEGRAIISLLNIILLPIAHFNIFPYFYTKNILNTPLKFIGLGYFFLGLAYIWSTGICTIIERGTSEIIGPTYSSILRIYNTLPHEVFITSSFNAVYLEKMKPYEMKKFIRLGGDKMEGVMYVKGPAGNEWHAVIRIASNKAATCLIFQNEIIKVKGYDKILPRFMFRPKVFFYCASKTCGNGTITLQKQNRTMKLIKKIPPRDGRTRFHLPETGIYDLFINNVQIPHSEPLLNGGVYSRLIMYENGVTTIRNYELVPPNNLHFLWTLPQYILLSIADVLAVVALNVFVYTQSPLNLRVLNFGIIFLIKSLGDIALIRINEFRSSYYGHTGIEGVIIFGFLLVYMFTTLRYKYKLIKEK